MKAESATVLSAAAAVAAAVSHFESTTGQRAHPGESRIVGSDERGIVVRVRHGHSRPPQRAWYLIGTGGVFVAELSQAEAACFGERPWR